MAGVSSESRWRKLKEWLELKVVEVGTTPAEDVFEEGWFAGMRDAFMEVLDKVEELENAGKSK